MQETFLTEFQKRGYFNQCTDESGLIELMSKSKIKAYIGFDCTAPSLHVGSLMQIMCLRLLQKYGHQPIILLGGGTTLIGDPSGKEETRKILSKKEIDKNIKNIEDVFKILLKSKNSKTKPIFVNNYSWLSKLNNINFLREIGKHFTKNKMLTFDSVKLRLEREQSLSYMEFNYMILQAFDFYELNKRQKCILQIGGSDQWGNIVNGTDLIKRKDKMQAYGLTTPFITTSSGAKMGKTEKGAIWLNKKMLSAYEKRKGDLPSPGQDVENFQIAKKFSEKFDILAIEIIANSNGIYDLSVGHPSSTSSISKSFGTNGTKDIGKHKTMIISTGKESSNNTLSKSLSSLWNCSDAVKNDGFAILLAECKLGIGSDGIQSFIDGRMDMDRLKKPSQYIDGMENLLYIAEIQKKFQLGLLSILPTHYTKKLNMIQFDGIKQVMDYVLKNQGQNQKVEIISDGARTLLR